MSTVSIYSNIVKFVSKTIAEKPAEPLTQLITEYIRSKNYEFETLEDLCLSSHYNREMAPMHGVPGHQASAAHDLIVFCARTVITEKYYNDEDRKWESPCVAGVRRTPEEIAPIEDYGILYYLSLSSIGYGINQALFGIFRNFREPHAERDAVGAMVKAGTIWATIDAQCDLIRDFVHDTMFHHEAEEQLVLRGTYTLGLLRIIREELKSYSGYSFRQSMIAANEHEERHLLGGFFSLIRRNTRDLRCELSYLAVKAATQDSATIRLIAQHAKKHAISIASVKHIRENG